ncbi:MAG: trypsin-like peptidase domain-containing protein [Candidatus Neomarinimicrobiota bacterium]|nr:trypsin-like peptidase domain-containing protein [Candidatus Neomarinimicrobiota bacterium]
MINKILIVLFLIGNFLNSQEDLHSSRYNAITRAIQNISPAVASVNVIQLKEIARKSPFSDPFFEFFFPYELHREKVKSSGSGVVISPDGYVLTNYHVIENAHEIIVTLPGGEEYKSEIIGKDRFTDLALLKMEGSNFPYADLGNSDDLIIGEWVVALGNPYGLFDVSDQPTATVGIISALNMDFGQQESGQIFQDMIQTDAAINPGNSGGPLVNGLGEIVGINTFIYTGSNYSQGSIGISFAIPINRAKQIAEELKNKGKIDRNYSTGLQVQSLNKRVARYLNLPFVKGVIVVEVKKGSSGDKAGIEIEDIILAVNGVQITSAQDIKNVILDQDIRSGDRITVKIYRDGVRKQVRLKLEKVNNSYYY